MYLILLYATFPANELWGYFWGYRPFAESDTPSADTPTVFLQNQDLLNVTMAVFPATEDSSYIAGAEVSLSENTGISAEPK